MARPPNGDVDPSYSFPRQALEEGLFAISRRRQRAPRIQNDRRFTQELAWRQFIYPKRKTRLRNSQSLPLFFPFLIFKIQDALRPAILYLIYPIIISVGFKTK